MGKKYKIAVGILLLVGIAGLLTFLVQGNSIPVLQPKGVIASQQKDLLIFASLLSLLVVIPVLALVFGIAWKYRASNKKAEYKPEWEHSKTLETIWWGIPILLIAVLGVVIWNSSHNLDPYKPLASDKKAIEVQVVALQWKWLFIYPEQKIASVNYLQFPKDTPVNFTITADSPMNSFWIPQLSGQVYAMSGMTTKLHIMATENGEYRGSSANLSGEGYAGMNFTAKATSDADFATWVKNAQASTSTLSLDVYNKLADPSKNNKVQQYTLEQQDVFDAVVMKYMAPPVKDTKKEGSHE